jgi:hypothetical protein
MSSEKVENTKTLYIVVDTFDYGGERIGTRIVDMYHFGTRNWLQNHQWWAMHNGHTVETKNATNDEISEYLESQRTALAEKYNPGPQAQIA